MQVTAKQLKRVLVFLRDGRFSRLLHGVLGLASDPNPELNNSQVLSLALFDWLEHLGCIDHEQQKQIVDNFAREIDDVAVLGIPPRETLLTPVLLTIGDGRFVAATGVDQWYDLQTDKWLKELPEPTVTWLVCDLNALSIRVGFRLRGAFHGGTDAHDEQHTRTNANGGVC